MYARITTYQVQQDKVDEMEARLVGIKEQIKAISGVVSAHTAWRKDGHGVTTAIYESQQAAEAAGEKVQAIWASVGELLAAAPSADGFDNVTDLLD